MIFDTNALTKVFLEEPEIKKSKSSGSKFYPFLIVEEIYHVTKIISFQADIFKHILARDRSPSDTYKTGSKCIFR